MHLLYAKGEAQLTGKNARIYEPSGTGRGEIVMSREIRGFVPNRFVLAFFGLLLIAATVFSQAANPYKSQEVSESDGIPVLIKHLPEWEAYRSKLTFARDANALRQALGERPVFDLIDFSAGTEAVTAPYDAGKLLIVEFTTPQASIDADEKINQRLSELGPSANITYRRIGNYNAFVFDAADPAVAGTLLDQIKYEKNIQWLGDDPFLLRRAERAFINTTSDVFVSTLIWITMGLGFSIFGGIVTGLVFFRIREMKRRSMPTFSDAGGMTRLNLDGFTPDIVPKGLLGD